MTFIANDMPDVMREVNRLTSELMRVRAALETQHAATDALLNENTALRAEVDKLKADYNSEIDEFNAGYEAGKAGVPLEDAEQKWDWLNDNRHDVFAPGYAWGAFDELRSESETLRAALAQHTFSWETTTFRDDVRNQIIKDGLNAISECETLRARAEGAERERDEADRASGVMLGDYQDLNDLIGSERRAHSDQLAKLESELATLRAERDALADASRKSVGLAETCITLVGYNRNHTEERERLLNDIINRLRRALAEAPAREPSQADATNDAPNAEGETK